MEQHVSPIFDNEWEVIWSRNEINAFLYDRFPLERGEFELEMSKEATIHQQTDLAIDDQANIWTRYPDPILSTPYAVLPLFVITFTTRTVGIWFSFINKYFI